MNKYLPPGDFSSAALYIPPWSRDGAQKYIPYAFRRAVCTHLTMNFSGAARRIKAPRMLGIQGPAGEGKTEMAIQVCSGVGCNTFCISGNALSGKHEGDAHNALHRLFDQAKRATSSNGRPAAVLVDDIDRSVAAFEAHAGHTINSQLLVGELQGLANADFSDGETLLRIAIILTGNNFRCLPETLTRPGRMRLFAWQPTADDKAEMVLPLFGDLSAFAALRIRRLVRQYHGEGEPLSFFVELIGQYIASEVPDFAGCSDIMQAANAFDRTIIRALDDLSMRRLNALARELHHSKAQSYIREESHE